MKVKQTLGGMLSIKTKNMSDGYTKNHPLDTYKDATNLELIDKKSQMLMLDSDAQSFSDKAISKNPNNNQLPMKYFNNNYIYKSESKPLKSIIRELKYCKEAKKVKLNLQNATESNAVMLTELALIAKIISTFNSLQVVDLSHSNLNDEQLNSFISNLTSKSIKVLNLSNNNMSRKGAQSLAKCTNSLPNLDVLNLDSNPIKNSGALSIIESFKSLTCLSLSSCGLISDSVLHSLISSELRNSLQYLNLDFNKLDNISLLCLQDTTWSKLTELSMRMTLLDDAGVDYLVKFLRNNHLSCLNLDYNQITKEVLSNALSSEQIKLAKWSCEKYV
jgi:Ran GTPase-activating protein (RanGAP) involved in mRNA processing and transport